MISTDDIRPELVLKANGALHVYFPLEKDYEYEAKEFLYSTKIPLIEASRTEELVTFTFSKDVVGKNVASLQKKLEDLFMALYMHPLHKELVVKGDFIIMGDNGFIIKYEPGDVDRPFNAASINGFLRLKADTISKLLNKYVYSTTYQG